MQALSVLIEALHSFKDLDKIATDDGRILSFFEVNDDQSNAS